MHGEYRFHLTRWVLQATCAKWDSPSCMYTSAKAAHVPSAAVTSGSLELPAAERLRLGAGSASAFLPCLPNSIASSSCVPTKKVIVKHQQAFCWKLTYVFPHSL